MPYTDPHRQGGEPLSPEPVVPPHVKVAAKRGFIRTTAQAYATSLTGLGITAALLYDVVSEFDPLRIGVSVAAFALSPLAAGLASYLDILRKGIPEDYQE